MLITLTGSLDVLTTTYADISQIQHLVDLDGTVPAVSNVSATIKEWKKLTGTVTTISVVSGEIDRLRPTAKHIKLTLDNSSTTVFPTIVRGTAINFSGFSPQFLRFRNRDVDYHGLKAGLEYTYNGGETVDNGEVFTIGSESFTAATPTFENSFPRDRADNIMIKFLTSKFSNNSAECKARSRVFPRLKIKTPLRSTVQSISTVPSAECTHIQYSYDNSWAWKLDGANDYGYIPHSTDLYSGSLTIGMWVKPTILPDQNKIICYKRSDPFNTLIPGAGFTLRYTPAGFIEAVIVNSSNTIGTISSGLSIELNEWTFVGLSINSDGVVILAINNVQSDIFLDPAGNILNSNHIYFGGVPNGYVGLANEPYFEGYIDEVGIWITPLDSNNLGWLREACCVTTDFRRNREGYTNAANLKSYIRFGDELSTSGIIPTFDSEDVSGNENHFFLVNGSTSTSFLQNTGPSCVCKKIFTNESSPVAVTPQHDAVWVGQTSGAIGTHIGWWRGASLPVGSKWYLVLSCVDGEFQYGETLEYSGGIETCVVTSVGEIKSSIACDDSEIVQS